jgi:hypothetical protein
MNALSELIYEPVNEEYGWGKYGTFKVLIRRKDGWINVTKLCKDGGKELKHWNENDTSKSLVQVLKSSVGIPTDVLTGGQDCIIRGTYAHPFLVPHIASWISPEFAFRVSRIVNDHLVREYREQIREKNTQLDEMVEKLNAQAQEWRAKFDTQSKKIDKLTAINLNQTSLLENQQRMLQVVNENVIESVSALHHVSDKSVPYERLADELTEQLVLINTEGAQYAAIRAQSKYVEKKLQTLRREHPDLRIAAQMPQRPNSRELWFAVRGTLENAGIEVHGTRFQLARDREPWLVSVLDRCNREKYSELLETKENINERVNEATEEQTRPFTAVDLLALKLTDLKALCKEKKLRGWSKLRKSALVDFILTSTL